MSGPGLLARRDQLLATLRQWAYPRELRIAAPRTPAEPTVAVRQGAAAGAAGTPAAPHAAVTAGAGGSSGEAVGAGFLAELGTGLWRLRKQLVEPGSGQPRAETRRAFRHLDALWDSCVHAGMEILDHTGEDFPDHGEVGLKTLDYRPTPQLARPSVIETIRPTLYFRKRRIQMGEVVVGVPAAAAGQAETVREGSA